MKSILFLLFTVFLTSFGFSQDIITKTDGNQIEAVVIKVSEDEIEYKRFDNQEGPVYVIDKDKVFMINYSNGSKDVFPIQNLQDTIQVETETTESEELIYDKGVWYKGKKIKSKEIRSLYANYPEARRAYNGSKILGGLSIPFAVVGGGFLGYGLGMAITGNYVPPGFWIVGGTFTVLTIITAVSADSKVKKSVKIYNRSIKYSNNTSNLNIKFGFTQYGIGLSCKF